MDQTRLKSYKIEESFVAVSSLKYIPLKTYLSTAFINPTKFFFQFPRDFRYIRYFSFRLDMMSPAMFPLLLTLGVFTSVVFCDSDHHDHGGMDKQRTFDIIFSILLFKARDILGREIWAEIFSTTATTTTAAVLAAA